MQERAGEAGWKNGVIGRFVVRVRTPPNRVIPQPRPQRWQRGSGGVSESKLRRISRVTDFTPKLGRACGMELLFTVGSEDVTARPPAKPAIPSLQFVLEGRTQVAIARFLIRMRYLLRQEEHVPVIVSSQLSSIDAPGFFVLIASACLDLHIPAACATISLRVLRPVQIPYSNSREAS
jgi:hypothetical protein